MNKLCLTAAILLIATPAFTMVAGGQCVKALCIPLPDPKMTPGDVNLVLTKDVLCKPGFSTIPYRDVSPELKNQVYVAYGPASVPARKAAKSII